MVLDCRMSLPLVLASQPDSLARCPSRLNHRQELQHCCDPSFWRPFGQHVHWPIKSYCLYCCFFAPHCCSFVGRNLIRSLMAPAWEDYIVWMVHKHLLLQLLVIFSSENSLFVQQRSMWRQVELLFYCLNVDHEN